MVLPEDGPLARRIKATFVISAAVFAAGAVSLTFLLGRQQLPPPNVILIVLDAARADRFSGYGYQRDTTPQMDAIGRRGAVFLNHFSNASRTVESVPQMLSSRYYSMPLFEQDAWQWGAKQLNRDTVFQQFDPEQILLPQVLAGHGYRTAIIHDHGYFSPRTTLVHAFHDFLSPVFRNSRTRARDTYASLFDWLEKNREESFFIYFHRMSPHEPYPPKPEDRLFLKAFDDRRIQDVRTKLVKRRRSDTHGWSEEEISVLQGLYDSNLRHDDARVGELLAKLDELGLAENTVVIITADHGENLGEHDSLGHGGPPWDSVTHIPLIIHWPAGVPAGVRRAELTENVDLMPTILDFCGISLPAGKSADGKSVAPLLTDSASGKDAVIFPEGNAGVSAGIRTAQYKYFLGSDHYYELEDDPGEMSASRDQAIQEGLRTKFEELAGPPRARHVAARRASPPNEPFYLPIDSFEPTPRDVVDVREGDRTSNEALLEALSPRKPWLLTINWLKPRLFSLPANGAPPPITLSASLPNGTYTVFALVEAPLEGFSTLAEIGLRSRFTDTDPFQQPTRSRDTENARQIYLELGETIVRNQAFTLGIDWQPPPDRSIHVIHHLRFVPEGEPFSIREGDANREREIEMLRALGYF
jgi:arylsulfatase A-like enzyme